MKITNVFSYLLICVAAFTLYGFGAAKTGLTKSIFEDCRVAAIKFILFILLLMSSVLANAGQSSVYVQSGGMTPSNAMFSQDDKKLITIDVEKTIYVWDVETGREINRVDLNRLKKGINLVLEATFTNKKNNLLIKVMSSTAKYKYILVDILANKIIKEFQQEVIYSFSKPYDDYFYYNDRREKSIKKVNVYSDDEEVVLKAKGKVDEISKNGAFVLLKGTESDNPLTQVYGVYDVRDFDDKYEWKNKQDPNNPNTFTYGINLSNNGQYLLVRRQNVIELIDLDDGKEIIKAFKSDASTYANVSFSDDSKYVFISNAVDGTIEFNIKENTTRVLLDERVSTFIKPNSDENKLLLGSMLIDNNNLETIKKYAHFADRPYDAFFHTGNKFVFHTKERTNVLDIETFNVTESTKKLSSDSYAIENIDFQKQNMVVYGSILAEKVTLHSVKGGELLIDFGSNNGAMSGSSFSPDGKYLLLTYIKNNKFKSILWDVTNKKLLHELSGIYYIIFQDNKNILYINKEYKTSIWNIKNKITKIVDDKAREIEIDEEKINVFQSFHSPDNRYLVSFSNNNLSVYDTHNDFKLNKLHFPFMFVGKNQFSFSEDNTLMSVKGRDYISVYNLKTGKKIDIHTFGKEDWIAVTEDGYFTGSDGAEKYLRVRSADGEISLLGQYYDHYYRPDIVVSAMSSKNDTQYADAKPSVKISDVKPAPQVAIIDTKESTDKEELKVTLKITPSSGGIGQIRLYVDGVLVKTDGDRGLRKKKAKDVVLKTYSIKLTKGEHSIKAIVYNEANTMSSKEVVLAVVSMYNSTVKPNIYAVVVGINEYKNPSIALKYAVADAQLFAKTIKAKTKGLYGDVNIQLLTSKDTTSKRYITKTLKELEKISPNDLFIFFVASHGMIEDAKYHMITSNVGALSTRGIKREAMPQEALRDLLANIPTTKKFIVLDTCNSGALGQAIEVALLTRGLTETTAMKVLSRAVGSTIISASSSSQEALEGYKGHGLLTYVLAEGLKGMADADNDGFIKTLEIANYVEDTVPEIAEKEFQRAQYPFISPLGQGYPLVRLR